jgi:CBS domain-containing protein
MAQTTPRPPREASPVLHGRDELIAIACHGALIGRHFPQAGMRRTQAAPRLLPMMLASADGGDRMNVSSVLKVKGRSVATIAPTATLVDVARRLAAKKVGALVVISDSGAVEGIVSERDVVRALAAGADMLGAPVSSIMTRNVVSCGESDTIDELMSAMTQHRFRHMPVMEDGRLVGIVSIGDVVKHRVAEVELEASAMRDYISHG